MTSFPSATESQAGHIGARQTRVDDAALMPASAAMPMTLRSLLDTLMHGSP